VVVGHAGAPTAVGPGGRVGVGECVCV
jgi:hypothetical protein